jgi:hypothetical protein
MRNVNDVGCGRCPGCDNWGELTRYHPKDAKKPRKKKDKWCAKCINQLTAERTPFHRIKKAISNHKTASGEGDYTFKDIMLLHKKQGGMCAYCGDSIPYEFSLDHIIPKKFGGRNLLLNIILTCLTCNSAKQHFEPFFFVRRKGYKLTERMIQRMKGAYDHHDYECNAECTDCKGNKRPRTNRLCKDCGINEERFLTEVIDRIASNT